jgi:hypothetical protein
MKQIPNFYTRFCKSLEDPILKFAKDLYDEGYREKDVVKNFEQFQYLSSAHTTHLRNCIRDIEREHKKE